MVQRVNQALYAAAKNGIAIPCNIDSQKFILSFPRGAYTAARTVQKSRVFDYDGHIKRLVDSTAEMSGIPPSRAIEELIRPLTEETLRAAMVEFKKKFGSEPDEEYKLTVLVCTAEGTKRDQLPVSTDVYCHVGLLPPLRTNLVKLQVAGLPRYNAGAKDSAWVRERKQIVDSIDKDVEEIILMEPHGHLLLEGSQTNFYALKSGTIYTSEEGILKGTVRGLVLDVCKDLHIPVVLSPPSLNDIEQWEACFITSTSRLVLSAGAVQYNDPATQQLVHKSFDRNDIVDKLASAVQHAVLQKSSLVFPE